jgi:hypothetical protein
MDNSDSDDDQSLTEEDQAAAADRRRLRLISVLEQKDGFHLRSRDKIDELVVEFLDKTRDDIHQMLCEYVDIDNYHGLDSDRDTEKEIETAIRCFPEVLSTKVEDDEDDENMYPIQFLAFTRNEDGGWRCNVKAVSFIPPLARLTIELGVLFDGEENRGGLLCHDFVRNNVLNYLMCSDRVELHNQERHENTDDTYLQVLVKLREMGIIQKEDIQRYDLLKSLTHQSVFAEKRFRFLVEWDPIALIRPYIQFDCLPIHFAASNSTIQGFRSVFEAGIRYFPKKKGISLLFKKDSNGMHGITPFQDACKKFGYKK